MKLTQFFPWRLNYAKVHSITVQRPINRPDKILFFYLHDVLETCKREKQIETKESF